LLGLLRRRCRLRGGDDAETQQRENQYECRGSSITWDAEKLAKQLTDATRILLGARDRG
jgi:hypothetical protein